MISQAGTGVADGSIRIEVGDEILTGLLKDAKFGLSGNIKPRTASKPTQQNQ